MGNCKVNDVYGFVKSLFDGCKCAGLTRRWGTLVLGFPDSCQAAGQVGGALPLRPGLVCTAGIATTEGEDRCREGSGEEFVSLPQLGSWEQGRQQRQ